MDKILLFIPMYNCEKQIPRVLNQLNEDVMQYLSEIIVVNNRSTDNGEQTVINYSKAHPELPIKLLRNYENYGLGGSHKVAFNYAIDNNFDYIITLHGDNQADITDLCPYLANKDYQNYDALLGGRFMHGSKLCGYSKFRTFGNIVYNILFSLGTGKKILDLGSGLNMYKASSLKSNFYTKFKDNLMFNYCMIIGEIYYKHNLKYFPISWKEEDQVSNVKMFNQAIVVLLLLLYYIFNKAKFFETEHRDKIIDNYSAEVIYSNITK